MGQYVQVVQTPFRADVSEYTYGLNMAPGHQIYVCPHNPMTDLNIVELRDLMTKADIDVTLMLVLPPGDLLDRAWTRADSVEQRLLQHDGPV